MPHSLSNLNLTLCFAFCALGAFFPASAANAQPAVRYQSQPVTSEALDDERGIVRTPRLSVSSVATYYLTYASRQDRRVLGVGLASTLHIPLGLAVQVGATFRFEHLFVLDSRDGDGRFFDFAPVVQVRLPTPTLELGLSLAAGVSRFSMADYSTTGFVLNPELNVRLGRKFGGVLAVGMLMRNWPGDEGVRDVGVYFSVGTSAIVWSYR